MRDENLKYALIKLKALSSDIDDILSLLAENTGVVSSAESESSVYTDVRESNASGDTEHPQALVEGALEKITNTERAKCHRSDGLCFCNALCDKVKCTFYH